jgi:hypothetical protein
MTTNQGPAPKATRREWIGLAVLALACLLYVPEARGFGAAADA